MRLLKPLALILATAAVLHASDAESSPADELVTLFDAGKNMDATMQRSLDERIAMINARQMPQAERDRQIRLLRLAAAETRKALSPATLQPLIASIYESNFTDAELRELITFFKSPVGAKYLAKQPELQQATSQAMQLMMLKVQSRVQDVIRKEEQQPGSSVPP
jgi:uncharacterized protein